MSERANHPELTFWPSWRLGVYTHLRPTEHNFFPGELLPRVGFIVTNLTLASRAVVRFYNNEEQRIRKASKQSGRGSALPSVPVQ